MKTDIKECFNCAKIYDYFPRIEYIGKSKIYCVTCAQLNWNQKKRLITKKIIRLEKQKLVEEKRIEKKKLREKKLIWKPKLTKNFGKDLKKRS